MYIYNLIAMYFTARKLIINAYIPLSLYGLERRCVIYQSCQDHTNSKPYPPPPSSCDIERICLLCFSWNKRTEYGNIVPSKKFFIKSLFGFPRCSCKRTCAVQRDPEPEECYMVEYFMVECFRLIADSTGTTINRKATILLEWYIVYT